MNSIIINTELYYQHWTQLLSTMNSIINIELYYQHWTIKINIELYYYQHWTLLLSTL